MAGGSYYLCLPLASALLATAVVAILAATSAVPVTAAAAPAAADRRYRGRMVIIRAPGARVLADVSAGSAALNKWQQQRQQQRRRLVEEEVAPEFGGLLGAGNGGDHVSDSALDKDKANCLPSGECTKAGGSYSRGCTYFQKCSQ